MSELAPSTESEFYEILETSLAVQILGLGTRSRNHRDPEISSVSTRNFEGVLDLSPADMTCAVRAGTKLADLQAALSELGLCLPTLETDGTVGGAYMTNLMPGTWRDWVIGATYMLADGTVAKSGSHAVKSVAGYDVHRFMAGTRGSLAICLEVILRVYPSSMAPKNPMNQIEVAEVSDPTQVALMRRAKQIFDPTNKLNPGEWGFM